jgi:hypothetical protein
MNTVKPQSNEKPPQETFDFKAHKAIPTDIRIALYKSKIEEIELKLAVLRRSKEQNEPSYIIRKLVDVISNVVYLKNYLLIKKETLKEMNSKLDPGHTEKIAAVVEIRKREAVLIAEFESCLKKIGLYLYIFRLKKERLGQRYEIKVLPDHSMATNNSDDKELYYPKQIMNSVLTTRN